MKDETMAGYYQLLIAIFCNLNAREARYLYDYGPAHPVCRRMMYRKLKHQKQGELLKVPAPPDAQSLSPYDRCQ